MGTSIVNFTLQNLKTLSQNLDRIQSDKITGINSAANNLDYLTGKAAARQSALLQTAADSNQSLLLNENTRLSDLESTQNVVQNIQDCMLKAAGNISDDVRTSLQSDIAAFIDQFTSLLNPETTSIGASTAPDTISSLMTSASNGVVGGTMTVTTAISKMAVTDISSTNGPVPLNLAQLAMTNAAMFAVNIASTYAAEYATLQGATSAQSLSAANAAATNIFTRALAALNTNTTGDLTSAQNNIAAVLSAANIGADVSSALTAQGFTGADASTAAQAAVAVTDLQQTAYNNNYTAAQTLAASLAAVSTDGSIKAALSTVTTTTGALDVGATTDTPISDLFNNAAQDVAAATLQTTNTIAALVTTDFPAATSLSAADAKTAMTTSAMFAVNIASTYAAEYAKQQGATDAQALTVAKAAATNIYTRALAAMNVVGCTDAATSEAAIDTVMTAANIGTDVSSALTASSFIGTDASTAATAAAGITGLQKAAYNTSYTVSQTLAANLAVVSIDASMTPALAAVTSATAALTGAEQTAAQSNDVNRAISMVAAYTNRFALAAGLSAADALTAAGNAETDFMNSVVTAVTAAGNTGAANAVTAGIATGNWVQTAIATSLSTALSSNANVDTWVQEAKLSVTNQLAITTDTDVTSYTASPTLAQAAMIKAADAAAVSAQNTVSIRTAAQSDTVQRGAVIVAAYVSRFAQANGVSADNAITAANDAVNNFMNSVITAATSAGNSGASSAITDGLANSNWIQDAVTNGIKNALSTSSQSNEIANQAVISVNALLAATTDTDLNSFVANPTQTERAILVAANLAAGASEQYVLDTTGQSTMNVPYVNLTANMLTSTMTDASSSQTATAGYNLLQNLVNLISSKIGDAKAIASATQVRLTTIMASTQSQNAIFDQTLAISDEDIKNQEDQALESFNRCFRNLIAQNKLNEMKSRYLNS